VTLFQEYADPASGRWAEIGYDPFPLGRPTVVADPEPLALTPLAEARAVCDVVVIGSGAGGGVAAMVLAEGGASVVIIERGTWIPRDPPSMTFLRNHRLPLAGDGTSPDGHPRVVVDADGAARTIEPLDFAYSNNAITIGGGTRFFGAQAWRFHPIDFRMASTYGVPAGSALADWPISYDDLAPFYDRVEWEIGVAGAPSPERPRARGYPMPPWPQTLGGQRLDAGARTLGWETVAVPLLINTEARAGRPACIRCGFCVGFPCPVDAKNGAETAALPRAIEAGAQLVAGAQVVHVADDGTVDVVARGDAHRDAARRTIRAGKIVLAGGAVETARLLRVSGLGNDWVGDCLQGHTYAGAFGQFAESVHDGLGPGVSIATHRFAHGNDGIVGGGMLANEFVKIPPLFLAWGLPLDAPRDDEATVRRMVADLYPRTLHVMGPYQEIPTRAARVRVSDRVTDAVGMAVAQLEGTQHPDDLRGAAVLAAGAEQWLQASGATRTWRFASEQPMLSGGQHQAGTARMADTPAGGATDPRGRVWGTDRVHVADGSVHVTNGGVNPVLTIMALAWRTATLLLEDEPA
jgi:choline dehydrogenase-like flavoprotein